MRAGQDEVKHLKATVQGLREELESTKFMADEALDQTKRHARNENAHLEGMIAALRDELEKAKGNK